MSKVSPLKKYGDMINIIEESYNGQTPKRLGVSSSPKKREFIKMTPPVDNSTGNSPPCYQFIQQEFSIKLVKPQKKKMTSIFPSSILRYYSHKEIKEEESKSESDVSDFDLDNNDNYDNVKRT